MNETEIEQWFRNCAVTDQQRVAIENCRKKATDLAKHFCANSPHCPDQTVALRKLKDAVMAMEATFLSPMPLKKF